jgi:hypothetical protein
VRSLLEAFSPIAAAIFSHHMQLPHRDRVIFDQKEPTLWESSSLGKRTDNVHADKGFTFRGEYAKTTSYQRNLFRPSAEFKLDCFPKKFNKNDPMLSDSFDELTRFCENALASLARFDYRTSSPRKVAVIINKIIDMANEYWTNTSDKIWAPPSRNTSRPKKTDDKKVDKKVDKNTINPKEFQARRVHLLLLIGDLKKALTVLNSC